MPPLTAPKSVLASFNVSVAANVDHLNFAFCTPNENSNYLVHLSNQANHSNPQSSDMLTIHNPSSTSLSLALVALFIEVGRTRSIAQFV